MTDKINQVWSSEEKDKDMVSQEQWEMLRKKGINRDTAKILVNGKGKTAALIMDGDAMVAIPKEKPKAELYGDFVGVEVGDEGKYKEAFCTVIDRAVKQMAEIEPDVPMSFEIIVNHRKEIKGEGLNWYEKEGLGKPKEIFTIGYKFAAVPFEHLIDELERFNK